VEAPEFNARNVNPLADSLLFDLVSSTQAGDEEQVRRLLSLGVRPDLIEHQSGWSALHASVLHNPSLLPVLLEHTATPDLPKVMGGTALSYVVHELAEHPDADRKSQLLEAMDVLLRAGAEPGGGEAGQSPFTLARIYGLRDVEEVFVAHHGKR
jgi:hypothetical protein